MMARQTILITGGCGYLGSQLIRDLATDHRLGDVTIRILDNMQSGQYRALMDLPAGGQYQFAEGDILDPATLRLTLQGVDAVVHLAGIVRTPMSFENPAWLQQVNHWGTAHLVEACLNADVKRFIHASTTAVYGPGGPYTEMDVCRPQGPYARSKFQAEKSVSLAADRGMQAVILRLATLFGLAPVTRFDAVFNRFAYLAGVKRPLTVYGDGQQRRSFVHIRDASEAIRLALVHAQRMNGHVVNVVTGTASVLDVVAAIRAVDPDISVRFTEQDIRTHLSFDISESVWPRLGWQAQTGLEAGIREMLDHFRQFEPFVIPQAEDE